MFVRYKYLLSAFLLLGLAIPVFSFQPSGGVLSLDGEDDYAILPLAEHGYLVPRNTDEFTAEVWFYPKSEPKDKEANVILSQQAYIRVTAEGKCPLAENQVCGAGALLFEGHIGQQAAGKQRARGGIGLDAPVEKNQWNYMAVILKNNAFFFVCNNEIRLTPRIDIIDFVAVEVRHKFNSFFVGGYAEDMVIHVHGQLLIRRTPFHGAIDAIRFSNIARYDLPDLPGGNRVTPLPFDPPHRFVNDEHTLALWDFNDEEGTDRFEDTSGNGKTLTGMNGATVISGRSVGNLEIRPDNALTTTWGQIKESP